MMNRPSISLSFYGKEWTDQEGMDESEPVLNDSSIDERNEFEETECKRIAFCIIRRKVQSCPMMSLQTQAMTCRAASATTTFLPSPLGSTPPSQ